MLNVIIWALIIFASRIVDVAMGTVRVNLIVRGKRWDATIIGFFEVLIYIAIISRVVSDMAHPAHLFAYALGFAAGTFIGMIIDGRINRRKLMATIVCHVRETAEALENEIRGADFGVTSMAGRGREGDVIVMKVVLAGHRKDELEDIISRVDKNAFTVYQSSDTVIGGIMYSQKSKL
jgi:uncharacterized protein YebE (UPF0316 family)